jgi:hypothetical protein
MKYLQPPLLVKHTRELNITQEAHDQRQTLSNNVVCCLPHDHTKINRTRNPTRHKPHPLRTITQRPQPIHMPNLHITHRKWEFDPKNHQKPPEPSEFQDHTHRGSTHASRKPDRDRQYPSRNPIRRYRRTQQHHLPPYKPPATMAQKSPKNSENHPKTRYDRSEDKRNHNLCSHHPHPAHNPMCPTHTHLCVQRIAPRQTHTQRKINTHLAQLWAPPNHLSHATLNVFVNDGRRIQTKTCVEKGFSEK